MQELHHLWFLKSFLTTAVIKINLTYHSAVNVDKSPIRVKGEVHIKLDFMNFELPLMVLVTDL